MAQWMFSKPSVFLVIGRKNSHGCGSDIVMESISIIDSRGGRSAPLSILFARLWQKWCCVDRLPASLRMPPNPMCPELGRTQLACVTGSGLNTNALSRINDGTNEEPPTEFFGILICIR
jgi:hypothetical protein